MGRTQQLDDAAICMAVAGSDDISNPGVSIQDDQFLRRQARMNRLAESVADVLFKSSLPRKGVGLTRAEKDIYKRTKFMEELEAGRVNRPALEYPVEYEPAGVEVPRKEVVQVV